MTSTEFPATATAFWTVAAGVGALRAVAPRVQAEGWITARALFSGISRGTESTVFQGLVPASEWHRMRAPLQEGDFPFPVKYGYQWVGVVEDGSQALRGRAIFCLHPHQDLVTIPADMAVPLPAGLEPGLAVLAANMETAVNAVWDAAPAPGDRVLVIGAGVVGLLVARLCRDLPGVALEIVDIDPAKASVARALGLSFAGPAPTLGDCDIVFHASGAPAGLATALGHAGFEATVVELSWYGARPVTVPLGADFHAKRLTLLSSQVGSVATRRRARHGHRRRIELALDLLRDPALAALISGETAFADLPAAMPGILSDPATLCHRVRYP